MMTAIEAGAEDFGANDEYFEILTTPEDFRTVREALEQAGHQFADADIQLIPQNYVSVSEEDAEKVQKLIDMFEENDDVQGVYTNME
jgi:transcriptional/translational regulatory protein YebC/TACO1